MFNINKGRRTFLFLSFLLLTIAGMAQVRISSPYSRYGVGLLRRGDYILCFRQWGVSATLSVHLIT